MGASEVEEIQEVFILAKVLLVIGVTVEAREQAAMVKNEPSEAVPI